MAGNHRLLILQPHNLLPIVIFLFGILSSWETPTTLAEAMKEDIGGRKLSKDNNPGFISIDCGVHEDYLHQETGIYYKSDKDFINTGVNHKVLPQYGNNEPWGVFDTVRSFPEGKRNCYTLKPEQGKNNYYLIRVYFLYGNYDCKHEIPEFDLYVGADYWRTVQLQSISYKLFHEIVFFFSEDTEYLCLVNTGSGIPFISALELRPSSYPSYNGTNYPVALRRFGYDLAGVASRFGFGYNLGIASDQFGYYQGVNLSSRYRDDAYDRIWLLRNSLTFVASNTSLNIKIEGTNGLPVEVLRTAIKPAYNSSLNINYKTDLSDNQCYLLFHFAEIEEVAQNRLREFTISVNGFQSKPIRLQYLKAYSFSTENWKIKGDFTLTLNATLKSDLPPILNAMEIYQVLEISSSATDHLDVDAIMAIKQTYDISKDDWQGDPCLPEDYTWSGLGCRFNTTTPRIISLNLSASELTGEISSSFSDLQAMESLDLSNNELSGQVPEVLAKLPNLKVLNLSGNKFTGSIPQSLKDKFNNGSLILSLTENQEKKNSAVPVVVAVGASILILLIFSTLVLFRIIQRRRLRGLLNKSMKNVSFKSKDRPFTYPQIIRITDNFSTVLGAGGFGKVYLGTLDDNSYVAVKLLSASSNQGYKEFRAEAQLLKIVHHRNLVSLVGYCDESGNMALIYEYMANGNLKQHLLSKTNKNVLKWRERLQIAIDAAHGLEYLHNGCTPPIVHRDLKSANILLTETLQAKIADFGLSKIFMSENASHISTCPAGTPGYLDPEFHVSGNLNKKSDIYSFGIILFELITGQPAIIRSLEHPIHILQWLSPRFEKGDIRSIMDPRLQGEFDVNAAWKVVEIAMSCAKPASIQRPDVGLVLTELKEGMAIEMALERTQTAPGNLFELSNVDPGTFPTAR